ncbi:MAG: CorA family divalent cation transporter [Parasulfuritortus sp.]|nr:CorA family divalent cation transporter [Parasulfuritortus sp.]
MTANDHSPETHDLRAEGGRTVRHFRQVLLWPLQLSVATDAEAGIARPWAILEQGDSPWSRVECDIENDPVKAKERHYKEFVTFLPYVQRFLYGESRTRGQAANVTTHDSPMQVFRRRDVTGVRVTLRPGAPPIRLDVTHVDLHFFYDIDVVFLQIEIHADDLPWATALELLHRSGRAYPSGWDESGQGVHNAYRVDWLAEDGSVLASSDSDNREKFLAFVYEHRAPCIASHWAFLLRPLALEHAGEDGLIQYRQLEYHRMPVMAYLALDNPRDLTRDDFIHLGLVNAFRPSDPLPQRDPAVAEFEKRYCDDRYWTDTEAGPNTRAICTGNTLMVVGETHSGYFRNEVHGILAQFRHQFVLLFLIAHFHRAALLVYSDRMVDAINDLDITDARSQLRFRKRIRDAFEAFLRFTHRYWFHELSERAQVQGLFNRCSAHLGNEAKYREIKEEIRDMSQYLDSDTQRRQSNTVVRLTVVTTFGLIGTMVTGFLGMNLLAEADAPAWVKIGLFLAVTLAIALLTLFTVAKSKPLSSFLEALSDSHTGSGQAFATLRQVWQTREK